jgi:hypothetical protein
MYIGLYRPSSRRKAVHINSHMLYKFTHLCTNLKSSFSKPEASTKFLIRSFSVASFKVKNFTWNLIQCFDQVLIACFRMSYIFIIGVNFNRRTFGTCPFISVKVSLAKEICGLVLPLAGVCFQRNLILWNKGNFKEIFVWTKKWNGGRFRVGVNFNCTMQFSAVFKLYW